LFQPESDCESVEYELRRSAEASEPRIDGDIHGVTVVLPEYAGSQPTELLRENASWVLEKRRGYQRYREEPLSGRLRLARDSRSSEKNTS
jgi:predicted metal-dependent hydrolase